MLTLPDTWQNIRKDNIRLPIRVNPLLQDLKRDFGYLGSKFTSTINVFKPTLRVSLNTIRYVTPAGIEPAIFWMKTRCPRPLDDGAKPRYFITNPHDWTSRQK